MHKKILSKFNKLEKNYGEEFTISKNELHSIILKPYVSKTYECQNLIYHLEDHKKGKYCQTIPQQ